MVKTVTRCRCEWHSGDRGAVVTICRAGVVDLMREVAIIPPGTWEMERSRAARKGELSRVGSVEARQKQRSRAELKHLPLETRKAMEAYALRKARYTSQESK